MESVIRGSITYLFVWLVFRVAGKRTLARITTFDAVLLLLISEAAQPALVGNDNSVTNSFLVVLTLLGLDIFFSFVKQWSPAFERILDGAPLILMDGRGVRAIEMRKERVDRDDILSAAREQHGLANLDEVEYAVLEQNGGISIIPKQR